MSTDGLDRAARANRGKRMSSLLDEEAEADDEFWNQDAFKEDGEENDYEAEDEEADVFDSDFEDPDEADDDEDVEEEAREPTKKRILPPGHRRDTKKKGEIKEKDGKVKNEKKEKTWKSSPGIDSSFSISTPVPVGDTSGPSLTPPPNVSQIGQFQENGEIQDVDGERSVRKSTRTAVVIKQAEREAHQAALQALSRPVPKKKKEEERKISQEEMLLEAAQTEIQNVQALEVMLAREEEVKRKAVIQKIFYTGPQIRFHSKGGRNTLEFTKVNDFPPILNSSTLPYPKKASCVITGFPAKYRDPKTGLSYATKEAFKAIREKYNKRENPHRKHPLVESHQRKRTKVERERSGTGGRRTITKLKFKKVISMITGKPFESDDTAKPTEPEVQNTEQSMEPGLEDPVDMNFTSGLIATKNSIHSLQLSRNQMTPDLASLDMPQAFVETNEADFMLDDLEISNPSPLGMKLSNRNYQCPRSRRRIKGKRQPYKSFSRQGRNPAKSRELSREAV